MWQWSGYGLLLVSAATSASLLPGSSELVLAGLWSQGYASWPLWLVATFGNVLGSAFNFWLGQQGARFADRKWFPVSATQLERAERWMQRYGPAALLMSWLPVVGDPITLVAGLLKVRWWLFLGLVTAAKGARYAVLLLLADYFFAT